MTRQRIIVVGAGMGGLAAALSPLDAKARLPWAGPPMSARSFATARLMEAWSHGLDAREAAGADGAPSSQGRVGRRFSRGVASVPGEGGWRPDGGRLKEVAVKVMFPFLGTDRYRLTLLSYRACVK